MSPAAWGSPCTRRMRMIPTCCSVMPTSRCTRRRKRASASRSTTRSIDRYKPELLTLVTQVRPAIEDGQFRMYLQPKVRLSDGRVAGAEALIRWEHPTLGRLSPADFIPMVEKTVLLKPLTYWAIEDVVRTLRSWGDYGVRVPVAVNLSPRSLLDQNLPGLVSGLLERFDVSPSLLRLELTESFLVADSGRSDAVLNELARLGVGCRSTTSGPGSLRSPT